MHLRPNRRPSRRREVRTRRCSIKVSLMSGIEIEAWSRNSVVATDVLTVFFSKTPKMLVLCNMIATRIFWMDRKIEG